MKKILLPLLIILSSSGMSFAQTPADNTDQMMLLGYIEMKQITARELSSFCSQLDPAYEAKFSAKQTEWDQKIQIKYSAGVAIFNKHNSARDQKSELVTLANLPELQSQIKQGNKPEFVMPEQIKEKMKLLVQKDLQTNTENLNAAEQRKRCDYVLASKGVPELPPKELP
ncbi:hypothetical protein ACO0LC_20505 [Undibacterium sp. JH2W]|uniref:hypothetical protein n=1 Tax=Undibacterium sp. JH2W TaxID=3413037 RepID=UPI003BF19791